MSTNNTELDKIINEGKVSPTTAMVVFAVELKAQGDKIDLLTRALNDDNKRYAGREELQEIKKRVSRLENGILGFLGFLLITFVASLFALLTGGK